MARANVAPSPRIVPPRGQRPEARAVREPVAPLPQLVAIPFIRGAWHADPERCSGPDGRVVPRSSRGSARPRR